MNRVLLKLYILPEFKVVDCLFDVRISLKDNFEIINRILNRQFDYEVIFVDRSNDKILNSELTLKELGLLHPTSLYLYCFKTW